MRIAKSKNTGAAFYATMGTRAEAAWPLAMARIAEATGKKGSEIRDFLDSKHGRIFADELCDRLYGGMELTTAIDHTVARWMSRRTSHDFVRAYRVRLGIPMLIAFIEA